MTDIQAWLTEARTLTDARTYAPFTAKPDEYGDKIVLKSGGYSLQTGDWGDNDTIQPTPNTKYVAHAIQAFPQALAALQAVHDLHKQVAMIGNADFSIPLDDYDPDDYPGEHLSQFTVCSECWAVEDEQYQSDGNIAVGLRSAWPCPTRRSLDATIGGTA